MNTPKERPIIFSDPMVRAILEGRKTQTRRVIKPQPYISKILWQLDTKKPIGDPPATSFRTNYEPALKEWLEMLPSPYGTTGDLLWVREAWWPETVSGMTNVYALYRADKSEDRSGPWKPSIHMPKWASRIWLEVVSVRIERVQNISEDDARAEGAEAAWQGMDGPEGPGISFVAGFHFMWDSINAKRGYSWKSNPWVWVIEFKRVGAPAMKEAE